MPNLLLGDKPAAELGVKCEIDLVATKVEIYQGNIDEGLTLSLDIVGGNERCETSRSVAINNRNGSPTNHQLLYKSPALQIISSTNHQKEIFSL